MNTNFLSPAMRRRDILNLKQFNSLLQKVNSLPTTCTTGGASTIETPFGRSILLPRGRMQRSIWLVKVTSAIAGQGGRYNGKRFFQQVNAGAVGNLVEADYSTLAAMEDCIIWNPAEINTSGHLINLSNPSQTDIVAVCFGRDAATNKPVFLIMGGGTATLPAPQYQYMVLQGVADNIAGWDFNRAHPTL